MDIEPILEITGLTKNFGGVVALAQVDLLVMPGQIASLIGPNGAGTSPAFARRSSRAQILLPASCGGVQSPLL